MTIRFYALPAGKERERKIMWEKEGLAKPPRGFVKPFRELVASKLVKVLPLKLKSLPCRMLA